MFFRRSSFLIAVTAAMVLSLTLQTVYAAAPSGVTLTGTALTVKVGETKAINTLTITEDASPQVASTTEIRIKIPTTINAFWDTTDTTATLGGTAGGAATTSPTVSYPDGDDRTLRLNVILDYLASDTLTIGGLSILGYDSATAAAALTWSVDGGVATGTAAASTNITVTAGDASTGSTSASDTTTESIVNLTANFTTATSTPANGKIQITFPDGYSLTSVTTATCPSMDGSFALSVSGLVATITRSGGTAQAAAAESCTVNNVRNPSPPGSTGTFTVKTLNSSDAEINTLSSIVGITVTPGRTIDRTPPGPVTNKQVANVGDGSSLDLSWTNPTNSDFVGVRIYRSTVVGALGEPVTTVTGISYRDTGLTNGTRYYYLLRPIDANNNEYQELTAMDGVPTVAAAAPAPLPIPTEEIPVPTQPVPETLVALSAGDMVRGASSSAVYYYGSDGKRHVFPNETVYFSWYEDFSAVKTISDDRLADLVLGSLVRIRPGTKLVKIVSDPKVYAVESGGVLRWVTSEDQATALFGADWAKRVVDVDVSLFTAYSYGSDLAANELPLGTVFRYKNETQRYYVAKEAGVVAKRPVSDAGFAANRLSAENTLVVHPSFAYPQGFSIEGREDALVTTAP